MFEGGPNRAIFSISIFSIFCFLFYYKVVKIWAFWGIFHAITLNNGKHGSLLRKMALLGPHLEPWPYWCQVLNLSDMCKLPKNCMRNCTQHQNQLLRKLKKKKRMSDHTHVSEFTCKVYLVFLLPIRMSKL